MSIFSLIVNRYGDTSLTYKDLTRLLALLCSDTELDIRCVPTRRSRDFPAIFSIESLGAEWSIDVTNFDLDLSNLSLFFLTFEIKELFLLTAIKERIL